MSLFSCLLFVSCNEDDVQPSIVEDEATGFKPVALDLDLYEGKELEKEED